MFFLIYTKNRRKVDVGKAAVPEIVFVMEDLYFLRTFSQVTTADKLPVEMSCCFRQKLG